MEMDTGDSVMFVDGCSRRPEVIVDEEDQVQSLIFFIEECSKLRDQLDPAAQKTVVDLKFVIKRVCHNLREDLAYWSTMMLRDEDLIYYTTFRIDNFLRLAEETRSKVGLENTQLDYFLEYLSELRLEKSRFRLRDASKIISLLEEVNDKVPGTSLHDFCRYVMWFLRRACPSSLQCRSKTADRSGPRSLRTRLYNALDAHVKDDVILKDFVKWFRSYCIPEHLKPGKFYSREIAFVQSSGFGKSRLLRNAGLYIPSFSIILEVSSAEEGTPVPDADALVIKFLQEQSREHEGHIVAATFLAALINQLIAYLFFADAPQPVNLIADYHPDLQTKDSMMTQVQKLADYIDEDIARRADFIDRDSDGRADRWTLKEYITKTLYNVRPVAASQDSPELFRVDLDAIALRKKIIDSAVYLATVKLEREKAEQLEARSYAQKKAVVLKAEAALRARRAEECHLEEYQEELSKARDKMSKDPVVEDTAYLGICGLPSELARLFKIIDTVKKLDDMKREGERNMTQAGKQIHDVWSKSEEMQHQPTQFIFGIDNCGCLESLIDKTVSQRPQGIASFSRVMHDLEARRKYYAKPDTPSRRLWLVLVDTNSNIRRVAPTTASDKLEYTFDCATANYEFVGSSWTAFGMDHALRIDQREYEEKGMDREDERMKAAKEEEKQQAGTSTPLEGEKGCVSTYYSKMSIARAMSFNQLKLMGRALWSTHPTGDLLCLLAKKILMRVEIWDMRPIFQSIIRRWDEEKLDLVSFTIAALRFNLDSVVQIHDGSNNYHYVTDAVAKHMRIIIDSQRRQDAIESATPSEPITAIGAMILLNYGRSLLMPYCDAKKVGLTEFNYSAGKDHCSWANLLEEMAFSSQCITSRLVDFGEEGGLIPRMVLTRARDCTLPESLSDLQWVPALQIDDGSKLDDKVVCQLPITTVLGFLGKLISDETAKEALETKAVEFDNDFLGGFKAWYSDQDVQEACPDAGEEAQCSVGVIDQGSKIEIDGGMSSKEPSNRMHEKVGRSAIPVNTDEGSDNEKSNTRAPTTDELDFDDDVTVCQSDGSETVNANSGSEEDEEFVLAASKGERNLNPTRSKIRQRKIEYKKLGKQWQITRSGCLGSLDLRYQEALVNFVQFVPEHYGAKEGKNGNELTDAMTLLDAWTRGVAFISEPDGASSSDLIIPILVPKRLGQVWAESNLEDYDINMISIRIRFRSKGQSPDEKLSAAPIPKHRGDTKLLVDCAAIVIVMDIGLRQTEDSCSADEFPSDEPGRCASSPHVLATMATAKMDENYQCNNKQWSDPFLAIRIRGLNRAYGCMAAVDPHNTFQDSVDRIMAKKCRTED